MGRIRLAQQRGGLDLVLTLGLSPKVEAEWWASGSGPPGEAEAFQWWRSRWGMVNERANGLDPELLLVAG